MSRRKKPFRKPEIKRVKLVPEEAVLNGCKVEDDNCLTNPMWVSLQPTIWCLTYGT